MSVEIAVLTDYDGYFEWLVKSWVDKKEEQKTPFKHSKIMITAGPYRSEAVTAEKGIDGNTIHLDFYSALRTGFGQLTEKDVQEIIDDWL